MLNLSMIAASVTNNETLRLILLGVMILAVILILVGCLIAIVTFRRKQQRDREFADASALESEKP